MRDFGQKVPFNPGYYKLSFASADSVDLSYRNLKAVSQKKFWLMKTEPVAIGFINRNTAFFLGCMIWGGFLSCRFKDEAKEIDGNFNLKLSKKEKELADSSVEPKKMLEMIESLDRDCKYFLKRPLNIDKNIKEILDAYIEFAQLNKNFVETKLTSDVKLPKFVKFMKNYTVVQLDELCEKIYAIIDSQKIEDLLLLF